MKNSFLIFILYMSTWLPNTSEAQNLFSNNLFLQENLRRSQLIHGFDTVSASFNLRPFETFQFNNLLTPIYDNGQNSKISKIEISALPFFQTIQYNANRPYGRADGPMIPSNGLQSYTSLGIFAKFSIFRFQFQPEYIIAQNAPFEGFSDNFNNQVTRDRFRFFNTGDYPERFGESAFSAFYWGQSKLTIEFGAFETGISTQNIWWGPGQWNSLIFSNNAPGFTHLTLNTVKPAKTFLGNFEGQIIVGRLEDSGFNPTQHPELNDRFFRPFIGDWRYLNAINVTYNPKWLPGLFVGATRSYHQYNAFRGNSFRDYFPIFDFFTKERIFEDNENSLEFDSEGRDQQLSFFARMVSPTGKAEVYFEYGRRDHAFNWREAILNPEHARAYLFGFKKLFELSDVSKFIQVRGEITHQQESVNRYIRYPGLLGGLSWHTHTRARGFANDGQALGVGIGTGSNVQTLEVSLVDKFNKVGVLFERLENHQDFFYRAFGQQTDRQPWIDLSLGFLFDHQWKSLLLSSRVQIINGLNYQWQRAPIISNEFPVGKNKISLQSNLSLIYIFPNK
jgi:hypothetical protein